MKQKKFTQKFKLAVTMLVLLLIGQNVLSQIVSYDLYFDASETNGGASLTTTASNFTFAGDGTSPATTTNWDSGTIGGNKDYTIPSFSAFTFYNIVANVTMHSDLNGPRDFELQYSLSGGAWTTAGTFQVTSVDANYGIRLPGICQRSASLSLRWITTSYTSVNGGSVSGTGKNYIQTISIVGDATTQSSNIKFVSITPTTIKVSCTPGGGDRRIIKCNTTNSFSNPVDGFTPGAVSSEYTGAGSEQIVYDGVGSAVTVTINTPPYSNTVLYFRVFDYKLNAGDERYLTNTATQNPKQCKLETITVNSPINVRLTTATMGATVSTPLALSVSQRGIVWSYNTPVLDTDTKIIYDNANAGGSFSVDVSNITRGQTNIYYKGYVTNASGTIYSTEASFTNIPIFTGPGNWEDNTNWNVFQVPGSTGTGGFGSVTDSPIINGTCTLTATNSVTNLTINSGKNLTISTGVGMSVVGTLTNSNIGGAGILIKSAEGVPNGSLTYGSGTVSGTVEMFTKSYMTNTPPAIHQNKWQFFGIPVNSVTVGNSFAGYPERVRKYDETNITALSAHPEIPDYGLWKPAEAYDGQALESSTMTAGQTLVPVDGYEVVQPGTKKYSFSGVLNHGDQSKVLANTSGADYAGFNIIANPFPAAIDIKLLTFGSNLDAAVYLYNTGSRDDWTVGGNGESVGQYIASNPTHAGELGIPRQIPSMQGFCVISNGNSNNTITLPYSSVMINNTAQRAPASIQSGKVGSRIDLIGSQYADKMWIFTDPSCTSSFDNGYDAYKLAGSALTPQIYAMEASDNYQIDAVNDINNIYLGFSAGQDTNLKLVFTHQNIESYGSIYLVDLVANKTIDITASGTEYAFSAVNNLATKRFKIITQSTGISAPSDNNAKLKIFNTQEAIFIQNSTDNTASYMLYSVSGKLIERVSVDANSLKTISTNGLNAGVYIAKSETETEKVTQRIIIR